jgi:hypothetical protein
MTSAAIAAAGALTFALAASASASLIVGMCAALFTFIVPPRYYDYDKVFFYMAGLAFCWRYVDVPTRGWLAAAGVVTALGAMFRYDNGLYVLVACMTAIVVRHWRSPGRIGRDIAFYIGVVAATLAPALLFIHFTAGIPEAFRQIATYASLEGERSKLLSLPPLTRDRTSALYVFMIAAGPVAFLFLPFQRKEPQPSVTFASAKILATVVLCGCVCLFVLRNPINARLGAAAPLAAVLAAWIVGQWPWRPAIPGRALALLVGTLTVLAAAASPRFGTRSVGTPLRIAERLQVIAGELRSSPPRPSYFPQGALDGLPRYLRECTTPEARVLLTWFAPEVFFFAERGFAGGMAVFLGTHWSSDGDQHRTIEQLEAQAAPLAIIQTSSEAEFRATFSHVASYIDVNYRVAGVTNFGDPRVDEDGYRIAIRRTLDNIGTEPRWGLPCLR